MTQLTIEENFLQDAAIEDMALYEVVKSAYLEAMNEYAGDHIYPGQHESLWFTSRAFKNLKRVLSEPQKTS